MPRTGGAKPLHGRDLANAGIRPDVIEVVQLLTRSDAVPDEAYYAAIRRHLIALRVKLADLADNQAPWRVNRLEPALRAELAAKYAKAHTLLGVDAAAAS